MAQEFCTAYLDPLSSEYFRRFHSRCDPGLRSIWSSNWQRICFWAPVAVGRIQFFAGCWTGSPIPRGVLTGGPLSSFRGFLSSVAACYVKSRRERVHQQVEVMVLCSVNMEVNIPSHLLYSVHEKQGIRPTHTPGVGLHKCVKAKKKRSLGAILESASHKAYLFLRVWQTRSSESTD